MVIMIFDKSMAVEGILDTSNKLIFLLYFSINLVILFLRKNPFL